MYLYLHLLSFLCARMHCSNWRHVSSEIPLTLTFGAPLGIKYILKLANSTRMQEGKASMGSWKTPAAPGLS